MLYGELVTLRAQLPADIPVLHAELHDDIATHVLADGGPWLPMAPDAAKSPFSIKEPREDVAPFAVIEDATGELAGAAALWGIDLFNRNAEIGIRLRPGVRGRGLGPDVVTTLCHYGFTILGLHRLQIATASDNQPMRKTALKAGFSEEGVKRQAYWTAGRFVDDIVFGMLASEWKALPTPSGVHRAVASEPRTTPQALVDGGRSA